MLAAALLAAAVAQPAGGSALADAAAYCQWKVGLRTSDRYQMPPGATAYANMAPEAAAMAKRRGMKIGPTVEDMAELVTRFAQTQPMSQAAGSPALYEYIAYTRDGSQAWSVAYPNLAACDVLVTASPRFIEERDSLMAAAKRNGWTVATALPDANAPFWEALLLKQIAAPEKNTIYRMILRGLPAATADPDGVQMEVQFARSERAN